MLLVTGFTMADIAVHHLVKCFRSDIVAVDDCTLTVDDGTCTVIVGPSGCGKTTLLRLIAGLETPDNGTVRIDDKDVTASQPRERDVAMIFQDFALYPHMRVRQNLAFASMLGRTPRRDINRRMEHIAAMLDIAHLLDRRPSELSGGQRQRVAVGRVLMRQPACALYDEPLSNLDALLRVQLRSDLKRLHMQFRTTSIFVTHDQEEAMSLADQLIVMANGVIQQTGSPLNIYRAPANRFVAGFIGSPMMNFIDGVVALVDGRRVFSNQRDVELPLDDKVDLATGTPIVLGIRPEAWSLHGNGPAITMRCEVNYHLGTHVHVQGQTEAGQRVTARLDAPCSVGEVCTLHLKGHGIHFFEPGQFGTAHQ